MKINKTSKFNFLLACIKSQKTKTYLKQITFVKPHTNRQDNDNNSGGGGGRRRRRRRGYHLVFLEYQRGHVLHQHIQKCSY